MKKQPGLTNFQFHFTKEPDGGWSFDAPTGTYKALRNEAGFAGRDWELWKLESAATADKMYRFSWRQVGEQYDSRVEAASAAYWLDRSAAEFWEKVESLKLTTK